jgi:hypothetical protein
MMNYTKRQWSTDETFEGVIAAYSAVGEMYGLEVQVQVSGLIVASAWKTVPATYWEPADAEYIYEKEFGSVDEAMVALEKYDDEAVAEEQRYDKMMAEH